MIGQQGSPASTAKKQTRRGELKAISLGLLGSALAMACSFGEIDEPSNGGFKSPEKTDVNAPSTAVTPPADDSNQGNVDPVVQGNNPPVGSMAPTARTVTPLEMNVMVMLTANCAQCHTASNYGNMSYITDAQKLIDNLKIIPGDAENSPIVRRIETGQMPPTAIINQRPSLGDLEQLKLWINGLADAPPTVCDDQPLVTFDTLFTEMQQDIQSLDADDRPFIRYIGVADSWNAGDCGLAFERQQYALSKVINSVSTSSRITVPVPVNKNSTLYRIDIRDYNWNEPTTVQPGDELVNVVNPATPINFTDKWEAIVNFSQPYGVVFTGDEADEVIRQTGTQVPFLPADAFLESSMTQQLYYALVDAPATFPEYLAQIGVNQQEQIDDGSEARAGLATSGVSKQERVLSRDEVDTLPGGTLWVSFDLQDKQGVANDSIFANPFDFKFAGGEMIDSLPNGLSRYYVAAATGQRLTEAPVDVVTDPAQIKNSGAVTNAVSCPSCHSLGFIPFADKVRPHVEDNALDFDQATFELVQEVYPTKADMDKLVKADQDLFLERMAQTGVPTGKIEDPVMHVYLDFNVRRLDLTQAAAEFGVTEKTLTDNMDRLDPQLGNLAGGGIDRQQFSRLYLQSLCIMQGNAQNRPANCQ